MPALTQKQLTELGHNFLACAQAVGNYRYTKKLSKQANKVLSDMHWTLLNYSDEFYTFSAKVALDNIDKSLLTIRRVTKDMHENLHRISQVQKAIDVATAAITLGAALLTKNPKTIDDAINKFEAGLQ